MLDHIGLRVRDFERSKRFYLAALAPLGIELIMERGGDAGGSAVVAGFGANGFPFFWINEARMATAGLHVALRASDRAAVAAFHKAALAAGGSDNGAPGLRPQYHPNYFGAFVLDPDGNNLEAVCHHPQ